MIRVGFSLFCKYTRMCIPMFIIAVIVTVSNFSHGKNDSILLYFGGFHLIEFFDLMFMGALVELCVCERNANAYPYHQCSLFAALASPAEFYVVHTDGCKRKTYMFF